MIASLELYDPVLRLTCIAIALWCSLSSLEAMVVSTGFRSGGIRGRDITTLYGGAKAWLRSTPLASPAGLVLLPAGRLAAGIALTFTTDPILVILLLGGIVVSTVSISIVAGGNDGADKIATIACMAAVLIAAGQVLADPWLCLAGLAWATGQLTIAYCTSGAAKLASPIWRDGTAIAAAMTSYSSGHPVSALLVRHPGRARGLAWAVMLPEILFPMTLFAPTEVCAVILGGFAAFHVMTALVMGLNTYPWAFITTYPCVLMANGLIVHAFGVSN